MPVSFYIRSPDQGRPRRCHSPSGLESVTGKNLQPEKNI